MYAYNSLVKKNKLHSEERNRNIVIWSYVKQTFFLYIQMLSMCLENNNLSKCPHQLVSVSHSKPRFCQCLYFYGFFWEKYNFIAKARYSKKSFLWYETLLHGCLMYIFSSFNVLYNVWTIFNQNRPFHRNIFICNPVVI